MKKKLFALTVAAVLTASAVSFTGCNTTTKPETPPFSSPAPVTAPGREVTESEWYCAFQFGLNVFNYTAEIQYTESLPVKVTTADYEEGNYTLNNVVSVIEKSKITADLDHDLLYQTEYIKMFDGKKTEEHNGYIALYNYEDILYGIEYTEGEYDVTEADSNSKIYWLPYKMFKSDIILENLYSNASWNYPDFTYNSTNGTYSGKITSNRGNIDTTADITVKINIDNLDLRDCVIGCGYNFNISDRFECAYNGVMAMKSTDYVMVSRVFISFKIYDYNFFYFNKKSPIPNELIAPIENAIKHRAQ